MRTRDLGDLPNPQTMTPEEVGTWVQRAMFAFRSDDPRSEFMRLLGMRIKEFRGPALDGEQP